MFTGGAQETAPLLVNGSFEQGLEAWKVAIGEKLSTLSTEQAASGRQSLKIVDDDPARGSDVAAARIPVQPGPYVVRGEVYPISGIGLGLYVRLYNQAGALVGNGDEFLRSAASIPKDSTSD